MVFFENCPFIYHWPNLDGLAKDAFSQAKMLCSIIPVLFQLPGTNSERPASVSVKGEITLVESVTVPEVGAIQVPPFEVVQQPKSFVRRHPFHGVVKETTPASPTPYVTQDGEPQAKSKKSSDRKSKKKKKKSKSNDAD